MRHPEALQVLLELNRQSQHPVSDALVEACFEIEYDSRFADDRTAVHDRLRDAVGDEMMRQENSADTGTAR